MIKISSRDFGRGKQFGTLFWDDTRKIDGITPTLPYGLLQHLYEEI